MEKLVFNSRERFWLNTAVALAVIVGIVLFGTYVININFFFPKAHEFFAKLQSYGISQIAFCAMLFASLTLPVICAGIYYRLKSLVLGAVFAFSTGMLFYGFFNQISRLISHDYKAGIGLILLLLITLTVLYFSLSAITIWYMNKKLDKITLLTAEAFYKKILIISHKLIGFWYLFLVTLTLIAFVLGVYRSNSLIGGKIAYFVQDIIMQIFFVSFILTPLICAILSIFFVAYICYWLNREKAE